MPRAPKPRRPGRPRVYGARLSVSMTPADVRDLRAWARAAGVSLPEFFARLVEHERRARAGATTDVPFRVIAVMRPIP